MRYVITDPIWKELGPLVNAAKRSPVGAKPEVPDRLFLEALLYRARTGIPWRDLPSEFGDYNAVFQRAKRWRLAGNFERLFAALPADSPVQEVKRLFIDSTSVRAHPHAAGAQKKRTKPRRLWGAHAAASPPRSTSSAPTRTRPLPSN